MIPNICGVTHLGDYPTGPWSTTPNLNIAWLTKVMDNLMVSHPETWSFPGQEVNRQTRERGTLLFMQAAREGCWTRTWGRRNLWWCRQVFLDCGIKSRKSAAKQNFSLSSNRSESTNRAGLGSISGAASMHGLQPLIWKHHQGSPAKSTMSTQQSKENSSISR